VRADHDVLIGFTRHITGDIMNGLDVAADCDLGFDGQFRGQSERLRLRFLSIAAASAEDPYG